MKTLPALLASAALCLGLGAAQAVHAAAIDLTTPGTEFDAAIYTLGFEFTVAEPLKLITLGVYDSGQDGLEAPAAVGLWLAERGTELASATVPGAAGATLQGYFRHVAVAPVLLSPGVHYVVAAFLEGGIATSLGMGQGGAGSIDARLTVLADRYAFEPGLIFPQTSDGAAGAWLGANFQLAPVPEPASALLLGAGLGLVAFSAARRRRCVRRDGGR